MRYANLIVSARTTLCAVSVMKDNRWLMHTEHPHICCAPQGGFWGMPSPSERCWGVGSFSWDATWKLRNSHTQLSPALHHPLYFFSSHIKQSWDEACLQWSAVDGLHWAFSYPGTWSPGLHVYWHLWTKDLPETRCDDQNSKDAQLQHSSLKATVCLQRNNVFRSSVNPSWCHDVKL